MQMVPIGQVILLKSITANVAAGINRDLFLNIKSTSKYISSDIQTHTEIYLTVSIYVVKKIKFMIEEYVCICKCVFYQKELI